MPKKQDDWNRCAVCTKPIAPDRLMCWRHWGRVPSILRQRVLATWRLMSMTPKGDSDAKQRAQAYLKVREDAIAAVRQATESTQT